HRRGALGPRALRGRDRGAGRRRGQLRGVAVVRRRHLDDPAGLRGAAVKRAIAEAVLAAPLLVTPARAASPDEPRVVVTPVGAESPDAAPRAVFALIIGVN